MSSTSLASFTNIDSIELLLRWRVRNLPVEYQKDFESAIYNPVDQRLIGNVWSLKWDGEDAYLI